MSAAKRSRSDSMAEQPRRSRRLMPVGYLLSVCRSPPPVAAHIHELRARQHCLEAGYLTAQHANPMVDCACTFVPPSWIEAAQRRLAFGMAGHARLGSDAHTLAPDLVELVGVQVVGFDHLKEEAKLKAFGHDALQSRATFRPLNSLWESAADEALLSTAWTALRAGGTLPLALTGAGFNLEVPAGPRLGSEIGLCNGLYVVYGERKGCPVLINWRSGYYCCRVGSADFPDSDAYWQWQISEDNPEFFMDATLDEWGEVSLRGDGGQVLYSCLKLADSEHFRGRMVGHWPIGQRVWTARDYEDPEADMVCLCTMTVLDAPAVKVQSQTIVEELRAGAQHFVNGVGAVQVSGFTAGVGAQNLCALRLNGCYERLPDESTNGFPHFQNEHGHTFYYAVTPGDMPGDASADTIPLNMWGFDQCYDYQPASQGAKCRGPRAAWILATPEGRPENPHLTTDGPEHLAGAGVEGAVLYPFVADSDGDGGTEDADLALTLLRGATATAAVQQARKAADAVVNMVHAQLTGMDVLVSGCPDQLCNGRYTWQGLRATANVKYPHFANEHSHYLFRNERGCDWRINETLPDDDDSWATKYFIDSEHLLPTGAQAWVRESENIDQMVKDESVSNADVLAAQTKHTLVVKLRRRRS